MDKDKQVKTVIFGAQARERIMRGLEITYQAVATTLGSRGRNVSLEKNWGPPIVIHDGVTVAKDVILPDPFENQAAQLVLQAAQNTNDQAGDGTTTATIFTYAIYKEALELITAGTNPMILKKGIEMAVATVIAELKKMAKQVETPQELEQIATISAADSDMGKLIARAIQKVGKNGVVTVQEGSTSTIEVEYKEGIDIDKGMLSPYMVTSAERGEAVYEGDEKKNNFPYIVLLNEKLDNNKFITLVEKIYTFDNQAQVLIIADEYDVDVTATIVVNKVNYGKKIVAIKSPEFGEHRTNLLNDIAVVTGGSVFGGNAGIPLDQVKLEAFGRAEKVIVTRDQTIIVGGKGKSEEITARVSLLDKLMFEVKTEFQKDKIEGRKAKIVGGVAVINVGAPSATEMREKKERVFDAVNATKAAIAEGIVPGGGVAFIRTIAALNKITTKGKEILGVNIVKKALEYPLRKLVANAGSADPGYVLGKLQESPNKNIGYNVESEAFEDLVKSGIIDPVKVSRSALENAASVATMLITTECMISFSRETSKTNSEETDGIGKLPG